MAFLCSIKDIPIADSVQTWTSPFAMLETGLIFSDPGRFYDDNPGLILAAVLVFFVLLLIILYLLFNVRKRRSAEEALFRSESLFRAAFNNTNVGMAVLDGEGKYTRVNETLARMTGYSPEQMIGLTFPGLIHPDDREDARRRISRLWTGSAAEYRVERRYIRSDGSSFLGDVYASTIRDDKGQTEAIVAAVIDQSERRQAEEELRFQKNYFEQFIGQSPEAVALIDEQDRITRINQTFTSLFGYTADEVLGRRLHDLLVPTEKANEAGLNADKVLGGQVVYMDTVRLRKDGSRVDVSLLGAPIFIDNKMVGGFFIYRDISKRKRAEDEIRFQKNFFEQFINQSPEAIVLVDVDDRISQINQEFTRLFGYTEIEALDENLSELIGPLDLRSQAHDYSRRMLQGQTIYGDVVRRRKDGARVDVSLLGAPIFIDGRLVGGFGIYRDISRRKKAEEALKQSEEKYRITFQSQSDSITLTELETGRYLDVNESFCQISGYSREEALGRTPIELDLFENPRDRDKIVQTLKEDGEVRDLEVHYRVRDGRRVTSLFSAKPIKYEGRDCLVSIVRDVTEVRKAEAEKARLEAQLQHAQKMEAVGTLASGIAHDFNNILQTISGYVQLCIESDDLDKVTLALPNIERAIGRAALLVQGLLTFGRKMDPELKAVDLNRLAVLTANMLERTIPKMIRIETDLAPGLHPIRGDAVQLEQVFLNLGSNAKDAMPNGGRLRIETRNADPDPEFRRNLLDGNMDDFVLLRVSDTGIGMPQSVIDHIFEPFFTTKEVGSGTGLGLSMVYGVIKGHGGYILCRSEPDQGTAFDIYLPVMKEAGAGEAVLVNDTAEAPSGREAILLVDDEKSILEVGKEFLSNYGYGVLTAESGEEALEIYRHEDHKIALIVMDLGMPGMGGRKSLEEIRRIDPRAKVLIATGYAGRSQATECLEAGAAGFIAKPYRLTDLLVTIRRTLDA